MTLREELIQVAAVAIAIAEDLDAGNTDLYENQNAHWTALSDVREERVRQEKKWGPQHHPIAEWLAILGEEYGEACRAALDETIFPKTTLDKPAAP